jgi:ABC-type lipoprotein release transport system permease subunit
MRSARRLVARREIERRWRSLVILGLLAGVAGGVASAAIAGARRSETAYERWRTATAAPDAIVFGTQVGAGDVDYSRVRTLPEVIDAGVFELAPVSISEIDGVGRLPPGTLGSLPPADAHLYRTVSRPLLRYGRLPDPSRPDEIVVNTTAARKWHLRVGQHVELTAARNLDAFYGAAPVVSVQLRATIVGIGDSMIDEIFGPDDPGFAPSGAFMSKYAGVVGHAPNLIVRLRPGTDIETFRERAVPLLRDPHVGGATLRNVPVRDLADDAKRITHATDLETNGLLLFALAVAAAALVLIGQAISRVVYAMAGSVRSLRSLGFTRRDCIGVLTMPLGVTAAIGFAGIVATAIGLSMRFPIGLARHFDPDIGVHADWLVLIGGAVAVATLTLLGAWLAARRATATRRVRNRSRLGSRLRRAPEPIPLPLLLGAGLALDPDNRRDERSLPVRPAVTGIAVAVVGIIAALALVHGIDGAIRSPARSGQVFDEIVTVDSAAQSRSFPSELERLPQVASIAHIRHGDADIGGTALPLWDIEAVRGSMQYTLLSGRAPSANDVAIGPSSAHALHIRSGDRITVTSPSRATLTVSGIALLPQSPHSSFDQGLWVSPTLMSALFGAPDDATTTEELLAVTAAKHTTRSQLDDALRTHISHDVSEAVLPQDVLFLRNVRSLPIALAIFLVFLAVAALGHALATAVRRRRYDLAVLRALGFRPRDSAACIAWFATTVAVIGLLIGIPLGIATGRLVWRWIADRTPLLYVAPLATVALVVLVPGVLLLANALAALPARRAARVDAAEVLRSE